MFVTLGLTLGACSIDPDEKAPQCPQAFLRPDAAAMMRYDGNGTDLTNLVVNARLTDVKGTCRGQLGHNNVAATAHAEMLVTRGPAAKTRDADIAYNVAVTYKGELVDHRSLTQHISFPPNVDTVSVTGQDVDFLFPLKRGLGAPNYSIYFVLALTPDELAANEAALAKH